MGEVGGVLYLHKAKGLGCVVLSVFFNTYSQMLKPSTSGSAECRAGKLKCIFTRPCLRVVNSFASADTYASVQNKREAQLNHPEPPPSRAPKKRSLAGRR